MKFTKHPVFVFVMLLALPVTAMPEELNSGNTKNAVFIFLQSPPDPVFAGWNIGTGYERAVSPPFSLLFSLNFARTLRPIIADFSWEERERYTVIEAVALFRYYPLSHFDKGLFFDLGAGYSLFLWELGTTEINHLFPVRARAGWKFSAGKFFFEPWAGVNQTFGRVNTHSHPGISRRIETRTLPFALIGISAGLSF